MCYSMFDPLSSSGKALQAMVQLNALTALAGTASTVLVDLTGTPGYVMAAGALCGDQAGTITFSLPQVVFNSGGNATGILATCTSLGSNAPSPNIIGAVSKMITPQAGWGSVSNPAPVVLGTAEETDEQLRQRQQVSTSNTAGTIIEAWTSALMQITGVTFARIYQNVTGSVDSNGIPANSVAAVVTGGSARNIANCIMSKVSVCQTYGNQSVIQTDTSGTEYTIQYTIPIVLTIAMALTLHVTNSTLWPSNGVTLVQDAVALFSARGMGSLNVTTAYDQVGYLPGQEIDSSDFYPAILTVAGVRITSLLLAILMPPPTLSTHGTALGLHHTRTP